MKKTNTRAAATLIAVALFVALGWFFGTAKNTTKAYEGMSYPANGTVLRAAAKAQEVLMSNQDTAYDRAIAYARNVRVDLFGEQGDVLASNMVSGNGHVSLAENSAQYVENDVVLNIDNLGVGTVNVSVSFQGQEVAVSFTATTNGGTGANRLNIVDIHSYALPEDQRNITNPENGYHENVLDESGNIVGNVNREDITGTTEADNKISKDDNVEIVTSSEGDRVHSKPTNKPESETVAVTPTPTPEVAVEVVVEPTIGTKPRVEMPEETAIPSPEIQEGEVEADTGTTPNVRPTPTPETTQEPIVSDEEEIVEEAIEPTPAPTPVVEMDQSADQQLTQNEAEEAGVVLNSQYARVFIITADGTITLFGNGTENLVIQESIEITDLGNGFVMTPYGVFAK